MVSPDEFLYEYAIVRYVPRVDREEFVNIGLIMMCKRRKWMRGEVWLDETRLKTFDPHFNMNVLRPQASIFMREDVPAPDLPVEERYRWLAAVKSAVLQVSPSHPGMLTDSDKDSPADDRLDAEFERLFADLVL